MQLVQFINDQHSIKSSLNMRQKYEGMSKSEQNNTV